MPDAERRALAEHATTAPDPPPLVVVTGGSGLVGGNIVRGILASDPHARVVVVEPNPPTGLFTEYLQPHQDRVTHAVADVRDVLALDTVDPEGAATHLVHAAALCRLV
ncbi:hypothetical protein BH20ACT5_BH20ACT5_14590 [soil metagenome]